MFICLSPFAPENLVSRVGLSFSTLRLNLVISAWVCVFLTIINRSGLNNYVVVVVVVVFTLKAVPVSTQYFLTSVRVQLTRTPSVVTG